MIFKQTGSVAKNVTAGLDTVAVRMPDHPVAEALGEGKGENWWCVLFPPLCFLDFANGEAVEQDNTTEAEDVEELNETDESDDVQVSIGCEGS